MKNILITGCSTGIGYETALYLKKQGYRVFATARKFKDVEMLKNLGFESFYLDVTNPQSIKNTLNEIMKQTNYKLDVVFNNAGYGQAGALEDISTDILKKQFETNVFGLHELTIQTLKIMKSQGYGTIIQHSSVLGLVSLKLRGAYNASKYAIEGLTDTLRLELKNTNINITLLNTGPVSSDFRKNGHKQLKQNIDIDNSRFKDDYYKSLNSKKSTVPFNLKAIEVSYVIENIIKSKNIKPRYYITKATYILGFLKRILPTSWLDKILIKL
jgi:short-subunit dehydrogenase